jgi:Ca-activated chloride channel family protein
MLLPAITLWYWWEWRKKYIRKQLASQPRLLKTLLNNFNSRDATFRLFLYLTLVVGIVLALMNPRIIKQQANLPIDGVQIMLALDVSNSMLAADVAPNRFEKARSFAIRLAEALGGSRIGLLAFAGEARLQMPPSTDISAIKQSLQTLSNASVPLQGTNIASALQEGDLSLSSNEVSYKAMVIITDGEALEGNTIDQAKKYAKAGMIVYVVGVGTTEGYLLVDPDLGTPIMDGNDQQVLSRLDEDVLLQLADATGGTYVLLNDLEATVKQLTEELKNLEKIEIPNENLVNYSSLSPWILLFVFMMQACYLIWPYLKENAFGKKRLVGMIGLVLFTSIGFGQEDKKEVAAGNKAYKEGNWELAIKSYSKALEANPANIEAKFYKALAAFKKEQFAESANDFAELAATGAEKDTRTASFNNAGLALAQEGKLAEAIDALKQAFRANPADPEIRQNLQKALMDLKKQKQDEPKQNDIPPPPLKEQEANRKLQSVMDEERRTREKMKPKASGASNDKNW